MVHYKILTNTSSVCKHLVIWGFIVTRLDAAVQVAGSISGHTLIKLRDDSDICFEDYTRDCWLWDFTFYFYIIFVVEMLIVVPHHVVIIIDSHWRKITLLTF
jgi:hypothetical protein